MVPSPAQAWAAQVFVQVTGMLVRTTLQLFGSLQVHTYSFVHVHFAALLRSWKRGATLCMVAEPWLGSRS